MRPRVSRPSYEAIGFERDVSQPTTHHLVGRGQTLVE